MTNTVTVEQFGWTSARGSFPLNIPTYRVIRRFETIAQAKAFLRDGFDAAKLGGSFRVAKAGRAWGTYHLRLGVARTSTHPDGAGWTPGSVVFERATLA